MTPEVLAALHGSAFTAPRPWSAAEFTALLNSPHVFLLTKPKAFLLARVIADEAEILTLAVAPTARRRGSARVLIAEFMAEATHRGAQSAFLEVAADNTPARALYAQAGFAEVGRRRGYYAAQDGSQVDALVLKTALSGHCP